MIKDICWIYFFKTIRKCHTYKKRINGECSIKTTIEKNKIIEIVNKTKIGNKNNNKNKLMLFDFKKLNNTMKTKKQRKKLFCDITLWRYVTN